MTGRREELAEWVAAVAPRFVTVLVRRFGVDFEVARDAVHGAFVTMLEKHDAGELQFENRSHFENYLLTASSRRVIDALRHSSRLVHESAATLVRSLDPSIEDELVLRERIAQLRSAVGDLDEPYRSIFRLLLEDEFPLAGIAEILGTNPASIYKQYARGLRKLRALMQPDR